MSLSLSMLPVHMLVGPLRHNHACLSLLNCRPQAPAKVEQPKGAWPVMQVMWQATHCQALSITRRKLITRTTLTLACAEMQKALAQVDEDLADLADMLKQSKSMIQRGALALPDRQSHAPT